ncbi:MAG: cyanophycinase [Verrucomicrobiales bacterium]
MIVGGGNVPEPMLERFFELAGGKNARIALIPISSPDPLPDEWWIGKKAAAYGVQSFDVLTGRTPEAVDSEASLKILREATAIWFGGGRQWRFVDAYENTQAHQLMHDLLKRGGIIAGSSAGASIQAEYMARGNPLGSRDIMSEGYERGLEFLLGAAVDQHFKQRNRFPDMTSLMATYPQFLGIGLDESTALVIQKSIGEVIGKGQAHIYDSKRPIAKGEKDYQSLNPGDRYDLVERSLLESDTDN